jgi:hypothetical protein
MWFWLSGFQCGIKIRSPVSLNYLFVKETIRDEHDDRCD